MKVIFMGTPDFAVVTLEAIIAAGHEVVLVVTQPDKPRGRSGKPAYPPVKECALQHDLCVYQPKRVREEESIRYIQSFEPDIIIVAAFGQILPQAILDLPRYCCMNIHASLLPKYRGASPIQWAVINGDPISGVTAMRMDAGLDTGDIIAQKVLELDAEETGGSLFDRLAQTGATLCVETMARIESGDVTYTPQDAAQATHTSLITKEMGRIDWTLSAVQIERLIRGLSPWPSAYTYYHGKMLKVWKACVEEGNFSAEQEAPQAGDALAKQEVFLTGDSLTKQEVLPTEDSPAENGRFQAAVLPTEAGQIIYTDPQGMVVKTGDGMLRLLEVQLEGRKRMSADAFLRGNPIKTGELLGN